MDILEKMKDDDYYYSDKEYVSNSMLNLLNKSPQTLAKFIEHGGETTPAMNFGKAFHMSILEPEKFITDIAIYDGKTKRGKVWDEFSENNTDKTIITNIELEWIKCMEGRLTDAVPHLLEGIKEVPSVWENMGVKCKGKVDIHNPVLNTIIDVKTTSDKSLSSFRSSCYKYGYHRQAAFYLDGFQAEQFIFVVIEKKSPYDIGVYIAGDDFINHGREQYKQLLTKYENYFLSNNKEISSYIEKGEL